MRFWPTPSRSPTWTWDAHSSPPSCSAEVPRSSKVCAGWQLLTAVKPRSRLQSPADRVTLLSGAAGFGERLLTEVKKLAPKDVKIKVSLGSKPHSRYLADWKIYLKWIINKLGFKIYICLIPFLKFIKRVILLILKFNKKVWSRSHRIFILLEPRLVTSV